MIDTTFFKLVRLCNTIANNEALLLELQVDIEKSSRGSPLISIIKNQLKALNTANLGFTQESLEYFFAPNMITEIDLYSNSRIGIECFFMSEGTMFPIHDHPNRVAITCVLYGNIKCLTLDKTDDPSILVQSEKRNGKTGLMMFNTLNFKNCHSILALDDVIIIDIFMHGLEEQGNFFKVVKKIGKYFHVAQDNHVSFLSRSFKCAHSEEAMLMAYYLSQLT